MSGWSEAALEGNNFWHGDANYRPAPRTAPASRTAGEWRHFVIEIVSSGDRSREKLGFYGQAGVRELLVVDRSPWRLELFRLGGSGLERAGASDLSRSSALASEVLPLTFSLATGAPRPIIDVRSSDGSRKWQV
jgi:hypothetical protein